MGVVDGFDSLGNAHGLQDMYTDFDQWVCRFNARLTSGSSTDDSYIRNTVSTRHGQSSARTQNIAKKSTENTPHSEVSASLHKMYVDGIFVAQKIRKNPADSIIEFFDIFKIACNDHTNFDYVLLTLVMENGRKNFHKYIRSKI